MKRIFAMEAFPNEIEVFTALKVYLQLPTYLRLRPNRPIQFDPIDQLATNIYPKGKQS